MYLQFYMEAVLETAVLEPKPLALLSNRQTYRQPAEQSSEQQYQAFKRYGRGQRGKVQELAP